MGVWRCPPVAPTSHACSEATNLIPAGMDSNGRTDVVLGGRESGAVTRLSVRPDGSKSERASALQGRLRSGTIRKWWTLAFRSVAGDPLAGDANNVADHCVRTLDKRSRAVTEVRVDGDMQDVQLLAATSAGLTSSAAGRRTRRAHRRVIAVFDRVESSPRDPKGPAARSFDRCPLAPHCR